MNKEELKRKNCESARKYYQKNKEKVKERARKYYQKNRKEIREKNNKYDKERYQQNPEFFRRKNRESYQRNWGKAIERGRRYYKLNNKEINQKHKLEWGNRRKEIIELLGRKCIKCGFSDYRALQIDHIKNNGYEERKITIGATYYRNILKKIKNGNFTDYQLLCANCNWIKKFNITKGRKK